MKNHFRSKPTIAALMLVLLFTSMSFKCGGGKTNNNANTATTTDPLRKAAKAADQLAGGIRALIDAKRTLLKNKKITQAQSDTLTDLLLKLNTADKVFVTELKKLKAAPDTTGKAKLADLFAQVTSALQELNSKGLLPLGDGEAKNTLMAALGAVTAAVAIIQEFLAP